MKTLVLAAWMAGVLSGGVTGQVHGRHDANERMQATGTDHTPATSPSPKAPRPTGDQWQFTPQALGGHPEFMSAGGIRPVQDITDGWETSAGCGLESQTFSRDVDVPADWSGRKVFWWIDDAWPAIDLRVNGELIGTYLHSDRIYGCVDITAAIRFGQPNRLDLMILPEEVTSVDTQSGEPQPAGPSVAPHREGLVYYDQRTEGRVVAPYGKQFLIATQPAHIAWTKIDPDVAARRIVLTGTIKGLAEGQEAGIIASLHEIGARRGEPRIVTESKPDTAVSTSAEVLGAVDGTRFEMAVPFPDNAVLWDFEQPFLYMVRVQLVIDGTLVDRFDDRTGLRTAGIRGDQFTLNEKLFLPRLVFGNHTAKPSNWDLDRLVPWIEGIRARNYTLYRNHVSPMSRYWYLIADQVGLPAICQCCMPSPPKDDFDHPHWRNWLADVERMIRQNGNCPSVFMWSPENEMLSASKHIDADGTLHEKLGEILDHFHRLDNRPVTFEGDGHLRGRCETYNEHYPHRYGDYLWPVDYYYLNVPHIPNNADMRHHYGRINLKSLGIPIIFGETMWFPTGGPIADAAFTGDKVYEWFRKYPHHNWKVLDGLNKYDMIARAYNLQKVAAFVIQTSGALSHDIEMHYNNPLAVFLKEEHRQYFGGDPLTRTYVICNGTTADRTLTVNASVQADGRTLAQKTATFNVAAGDRRVETMTLDLPPLIARQDATLRFELREGQRLCDATEQTLRLFPRDRQFGPLAGRIALLDPSGRTAATLDTMNVAFRTIEAVTAETLERADLLAIGEGALGKQANIDQSTIDDFLKRGGNVVVLAQQPEADLKWLPVTMELVANRPATMAHVVTPHDLLRIRDLQQWDFHWWLDDHFVSRGCYRKPSAGNVRLILDVGTTGLPYTPLMEILADPGLVVLNQLACVEKFETAPVAAEILYACLQYGLTRSQNLGTLAVLGPADAELLNRLGRAGVEFETIEDGPLNADRLDAYAAMLIAPTKAAWHTAAANADAIRTWAYRHGGTVIFHRIDRKIAGDRIDSIITPWSITIGSRPKSKYTVYKLDEAVADPFARGLSNEWLWWVPGNVQQPNELKGQPEYMFDYPIHLGERSDYPNDDWLEVASSGTLVRLNYGRGRFVFDQLRWDVNQELLGRQLDYLRWLMTACRVRLSPQPGSAAELEGASFEPIDIRPFCNRPSVDDGSRNAWFGFGAHQDLRNMPTGEQTFADVPFAIVDQAANDGRSCIVLHGRAGEQFPRSAGPMPVNARYRYLAFHQAAAYARSGDLLATYLIAYDDGTQADAPVVAGQSAADWWHGATLLPEAAPAWQGQVADGHDVATYRFLWKNPHPQKTIASITVHTGDPKATEADQIIDHGMLALLAVTGVK